MLFSLLLSSLLTLTPLPAPSRPSSLSAMAAAVHYTPTGQGTPAQFKRTTVKTGRCNKQATYDLPAQRFDETTQAIAHASGCFIKYHDQALAAIPVRAVHGTMTLRQALHTALLGTSLQIVQETPDRLRVEQISKKGRIN